MVTESQARMDEYIEGRRLSQAAIIKEINDEKDKEIERLTDLNKAKGALIKAQAKKIGMLLKEKEWLLEEAITLYDLWHDVSCGDEDIKHKMQQALKEE